MHYIMAILLLLLIAGAGWTQVNAPLATPPVIVPTLCELMVQALDRCINGQKSHKHCMIELRDTLKKGVPEK